MLLINRAATALVPQTYLEAGPIDFAECLVLFQADADRVCLLAFAHRAGRNQLCLF